MKELIEEVLDNKPRNINIKPIVRRLIRRTTGMSENVILRDFPSDVSPLINCRLFLHYTILYE
jgi:hypothetical protein